MQLPNLSDKTRRVIGTVGKLLFLGATLTGVAIQVFSALKQTQGMLRWIGLGVYIAVLLIAGYWVCSEHKAKSEALKNERIALDNEENALDNARIALAKRDEISEAWDVATRAFDKPQREPKWNYHSIKLRYEITNSYGLIYEDESEINIKRGKLEFYLSGFDADKKANPVESLKDSGLEVLLECQEKRGTAIDCRVHDVNGHTKDIWVMFPEGLERHYPCTVKTKLRWPGFWKTLEEMRSDEVVFVPSTDVEYFEQTVVFPEGIHEDQVGLARIPHNSRKPKRESSTKRTNSEGRVELVWSLRKPRVGQRHVMRFTLYA
jgi:hypothetical protein